MKIALVALLLAAAPAVAQMQPEMMGGGRMAGGPRAMAMGNPALAGMSDAGKAIMHAAMRGGDPRTDRAATDAARDRMLTLLDAERLDPSALKRAMDDEREAAGVAKARHQVAMIGAFQQLSLADRRAFVVNARAMRNIIEDRMARRARRGPGPMAPPPPLP